jgi:DNA-binding MarR family transcriptional regulator
VNHVNKPSPLVLAFIALQDALSGTYAALSRPKLRLMVKLADGPVSVSDLAEKLHISSPAVSQMIDKLSHEGYVRREGFGEDLRVVRIALTPDGQKALDDGLEAFEERVAELMVTLSGDEAHQLADLINRMLAR